MYSKRKDEASIVKKASFMDIKSRVTRDVMGEYQTEADKVQKTVDENNKELQTLNLDIQNGQSEAKAKNNEVAACQKEMVREGHIWGVARDWGDRENKV